MFRQISHLRTACLAITAALLTACATPVAAQQTPAPANRSVATDPSEAGPVRNLAADPTLIGGDGVVTLRYWKIRKGGFPDFLAASQQGVWPYFEKIGARVIGMWQVIPAPGEEAASADYDEVYLATRYASTEHWAATRDAARLGGDGPDYQAMIAALAVRRELTIETNLTFLSGANGPMGPYFLPGTMETFTPAN